MIRPPARIGRQLLPLLRETRHAARIPEAEWEETIRLARAAEMLGVLACRIQALPEVWEVVPGQARGHLQSAINHAGWRRHLACALLRELETLWPVDVPVTLLKGAAYIVQGLPLAAGRMPADVDFLVPRTALSACEQALTKAGWAVEALDTHDERYYREWSHELPPMRHPAHALELDLHHTITPVTSRTRVDAALLFSGLRPLPESRYHVLSPADQIVHAVIHLFQDSDLCGQLRNLADIDGLCRAHLQGQADWEALVERAEQHGAGRLLCYALRYCQGWLGTPVPAGLNSGLPPALAQTGMDWVFSRSCPPRLPDRRAGADEWVAGQLGLLRYHWLRMPPGLLARHLGWKAWKRVWRW